MADEVKIIRIEINAQKAVDGSAAATRALANIDKSTKDAADSMTRMESALGKVGGWLKAQLVLQATEFALRMAEIARNAFTAASGLEELAQQIGITARGLQGLQYAAVQNGVSLEQLETGISKFSQKIGEAAGGSKEMIDALNNMGVKILDANGKLLPTETLLQRVAKSITEIEDPAKKSAVAVEFFGRAGAKLLASLEDFAKGTAALSARAEQGGALISDGAIKTLDKFADDIEKRKLRSRAVFAELISDILDGMEKLRQKVQVGTDEEVRRRSEQEGKAFKESFQNAFDWISDGLSDLVAVGARFGAEFIESLATIPGALKNLFVRGMDGALDALESGLNKMKSGLADSWLGRQIGIDGSPVSLGRIGGTISNDDYAANRNAQIAAAGQNAYNSVRQMYPAGGAAAARAQQRYQSYINGTPGDMIAGIDSLAAGGGDGAAPGVKNPAPTGGGGGESPEQKLAKLEQQLRNTAEAQNAMTAAARAGDQAFEEQKTSLDATQKLFDIFGVTLDKTDERFIRVRDRMREIAQGKAAESFNVATTELQKQNVILEAQIRLRDELPEVQARELALIKSTQEAQKAGAALSAQDVENRRAAIEQNERLKTQAEELKKAEELWTEPLKQALRDIQSTGADAFDKLLENGKLSFEELGQTFMKIVRRMAAEFLALATIRPVMSVLVNAVSPGFASSMGLGGQLFPGMGGGGMSGGGLGGMGGGSLFGGGFSSALGDFGSWLNTPFTGPYAGMSPSSMQGVPMLSPSMMDPSSWGITPLGAAGAIGGGAMGLYQLLNAKSTSGTIGGIASMVGAAVSLIPGVGQIAGPLIALAGNLLPGLFGMDKPPTITNQGYGDLTYGPNGWMTGNGAWGPSATGLGSQLSGMGNTMSGIFDAFGGVKNPSKVWGVALQSFSQQSGNNTFSNQTSFLAGPNGERIQWGQGSTASDVGLEAAGVAATLKSVLEGAVGEITDNMRKALGTVNTDGRGTFQQIATVVSDIKAFDDAITSLGKTVNTAEEAIKQIDASFATMYGTADKYGLSTSDVDAAKAKARLGYATDFGKSISRGILELTDPQAAALQDLDAWKQGLIDNNKWLVENVTGALDQINEIERLYGLRRAQIVQQGAQVSLDGVAEVIKRLTYGDLSGASPGDTLSGLGGTYSALLAKASAGDASAIASLGGAAADYAQFAGSFYGTSTMAYQTLRSGITGGLTNVYAAQGGNIADLAPALAANANGMATVSAQFVELGTQISTVLENGEAREEKVDELLDLMRRIAAKIAA